MQISVSPKRVYKHRHRSKRFVYFRSVCVWKWWSVNNGNVSTECVQTAQRAVILFFFRGGGGGRRTKTGRHSSENQEFVGNSMSVGSHSNWMVLKVQKWLLFDSRCKSIWGAAKSNIDNNKRAIDYAIWRNVAYQFARFRKVQKSLKSRRFTSDKVQQAVSDFLMHKRSFTKLVYSIWWSSG